MVTSIESCERQLAQTIADNACGPEMMRLAALDVCCGAADGAIVLAEGEDASVDNAIRVLKTAKVQHPQISWADIVQMAGAVAVHLGGGPVVPMKYGRIDTPLLKESTPSQVQEVRNKLKANVSRLADAPASRMLLSSLGLSAQHQIALAGEMESNFKAPFPALPTTATPDTQPIFDYQTVLYKKDEVAFTRDYAWAHARKSEFGAVFTPEGGLTLR